MRTCLGSVPTGSGKSFFSYVDPPRYEVSNFAEAVHGTNQKFSYFSQQKGFFNRKKHEKVATQEPMDDDY